MSKITIIDFLSKGSSHLNFNKSYIAAIPKHLQIHNFIGNQSHFSLLEKNGFNNNTINKDNLSWHLRVTLLFFLLIANSRKNITVLAFENYLLPVLFILFFPFFLNKRITMVVHNNVPGLKRKGLKTLPFKLFIKILNPKLICLTSKMKEEMNELGYEKNTVWIPHMNYKHFGESLNSKSTIHFENEKVNVVLFGRQSKLFIEHTLPQIKDIKFKNLLFHVFSDELKESNNENVIIHKFKPSQLEYQSLLRNCDYAFFPDLNVNFRPSGILLDCISSHCPIIAPNEGHFSEFSNDKIGWLYNQNNLISILFEIDKSIIKRSNFPKENFNAPISETSLDKFSLKLNSIYTSN